MNPPYKHVRATGPLHVRFWLHVAKTEDSDDLCWEWTASRTVNGGYGQWNLAPGKVTTAHRYSYELAFGPVPAGMQVCHRCDNRGCVRPSHLFLGTQLDNVRDMLSKGRGAVQHTCLTLAQVEEARRRIAAGETQQEVAASFGVSGGALSRFRTGKRRTSR